MAPHLIEGLPAIKQELQGTGLHSIAIEGIEADDAVAALAQKWCEAHKGRVIILSTDKDFLQLLSGQVCIFDHFKGLWRDEAYVLAKFGVKPAQMGDLLALVGDATDGIPGVDKVTGQVGVNLRKGVATARLSRQLVGIAKRQTGTKKGR